MKQDRYIIQSLHNSNGHVVHRVFDRKKNRVICGSAILEDANEIKASLSFTNDWEPILTRSEMKGLSQ